MQLMFVQQSKQYIKFDVANLKFVGEKRKTSGVLNFESA